jgi:hypothetical protein
MNKFVVFLLKVIINIILIHLFSYYFAPLLVYSFYNDCDLDLCFVFDFKSYYLALVLTCWILYFLIYLYLFLYLKYGEKVIYVSFILCVILNFLYYS